MNPVHIRHACKGDEEILAYIQTESWKAAFHDILSQEILIKYTQLEPAIQMYQKLLNERKGNGYILELAGKPQGIAWWDQSREKDMFDFAELICIHSLKKGWHKGYGSRMLEKLLADVKSEGYHKIMLWVFTENKRAILFYKAHGFYASGRKQEAFGAIEEMYIKEID